MDTSTMQLVSKPLLSRLIAGIATSLYYGEGGSISFMGMGVSGPLLVGVAVGASDFAAQSINKAIVNYYPSVASSGTLITAAITPILGGAVTIGLLGYATDVIDPRAYGSTFLLGAVSVAGGAYINDYFIYPPNSQAPTY